MRTAYMIHQASCRASLLVATAGFRSDDWEDLRQEMLLDCVRRAPKFDPARGDWHGFVRGVTRNQATVLVMRERRRPREVVDRDLPNQEGANDAEWLDMLDKRPGREGVVDALHFRLDVCRVVESLPVQLQSLAGLLGQMPVHDVCRHTGRSRSRVYQMTRQIREAFIAAGMVRHSGRRIGRKPKAKAEPKPDALPAAELRKRVDERVLGLVDSEQLPRQTTIPELELKCIPDCADWLTNLPQASVETRS